jgi:uncharacterized protein YqeY
VWVPPPAVVDCNRSAIEAAIAETGTTGQRDMGKVMKSVMTRPGSNGRRTPVNGPSRNAK